MGLFWGGGNGNQKSGADAVGTSEMLAELRAIRVQLEHMSERIGQAATRDDLKNYVTLDLFKHHLESHARGLENWRTWLPWAVGTALALYEVMSRMGSG